MSDGKVVYEIRGDSSHLEADLAEAEKKTGKLGSVMGTAGKIGATAFAAIGAGAVAVGTKAISAATSVDAAMNQLAASTGIASSELDDYENTLTSIYANNYGESFEDIGQAMATITQQLGEMEQANLQNLTESALALRDTFGFEVTESVRASKAMMDQFGISGEKAMNLIAQGTQNGLDYSGELIDTINEYSVHFAKVGLDAEDMFAIFEAGAESGAWNLDKVGDAVKELSIRVVDGSTTTAEGFAGIGLDADEMAAKFAAGGDAAEAAFRQTLTALTNLEDPLAQNQAGVALFGTMWEDLGPDVVKQLANIKNGAYGTSDALNDIKDIKYNDLSSMLEGLGRTLETLLLPLGESLIPIIGDIIEGLTPIIEEIMPPLVETVGMLFEQLSPIIEGLMPILSEFLTEMMPIFQTLIEGILPIITQLLSGLLPPLMSLVGAILPPLLSIFEAILPPIQTLIDVLIPPLQILFEELGKIIEVLSPIIEFLAELIGGTLSAAFEVISPIIETFEEILGGVIDFLTAVFSGDWEAAWEAIVDIAKGILNLLPAAVEGVINGIIWVINLFIDGLNVVLGIFGTEIGRIQEVSLPRFHTGGIVDFEAGEGLALLQDGEMVLTMDQQKRLFDIANGQEVNAAAASAINLSVHLDGTVEVDGLTLGQIVLKNVDDASSFILRG